MPRLGPPLPGDLGKPILEHQQAMIATVEPAGQPLQQAQAAERERQLAERKAARESGVLVQNRQGTGTTEPSIAAVAAPTAASTDTPKLSLDTANDPNAQGHKVEFVVNVDRQGDVNPHALTPLSSPYTLSAGSVISASLITGLRSDLPGLVTALVTENIYDSATGHLLLVPQGARLIGSYDSVVAFGQKRALIVWQRIVMPDGGSLRIDNVPATDPSGYAGLQDKVDLHTWQLLKGIALSTLLGVGSDLALSGQGDLVEAIRQSTQDSTSRAGDQITQRNLGIQPTITIRPARRWGWSSTKTWCSRRREGGDMATLKLGKLPDRTPSKLTITVTPELKQTLDDYARLYRETYGQSETVAELVPHMLATFLSSDRAFVKARETMGQATE